jgi:hypothetical protein
MSNRRINKIIATATAIIALVAGILGLPPLLRNARQNPEDTQKQAHIEELTRTLRTNLASVRGRLDSAENITPVPTPYINVWVVNECDATARVAIHYLPAAFPRPVTRGWYTMQGRSRDSLQVFARGHLFSYYAEMSGRSWAAPDNEPPMLYYVFGDAFADDGTIVWEGHGVRKASFATQELPRKFGSTITVPIRCTPVTRVSSTRR